MATPTASYRGLEDDFEQNGKQKSYGGVDDAAQRNYWNGGAEEGRPSKHLWWRTAVEGLEVQSFIHKVSAPSYWTEFLRRRWAGLATVAILSLALLFLGIFAFPPLGWKGWVTFAIVVITLGLLVESALPTEVVLLLAGTAFMAFFIIPVNKALAGFSNEGIATVTVLFVVAEGIQRTNVLNIVFRFLLGRPSTLRVALLRMVVPCALISTFLNNTPIVAMMIPVIVRWAEYSNFSPQQLLIPMSLAVSLGGTNSLIGTSTNLVLQGLAETNKLKDLDGKPVSISIFDISKAGIIYCAVGLAYLLLCTPWLLRGKKKSAEKVDLEKVLAVAGKQRLKLYSIFLRVRRSFPSLGRDLREAGFYNNAQHLEVQQLTRADTDQPLIQPPAETKVQKGDVVIVRGPLDAIIALYRLDGLSVATRSSEALEVKRHRRSLYEVVIGPSFLDQNSTFGGSAWEAFYDGALVGVQTDARELDPLLIHQVPLTTGQTVLVEGKDDFIRNYRHVNDFSLIYQLYDSEAYRTDLFHMLFASGVTLAAIILAALELVSLFITASVASFLLIATGCITLRQAALSIDLPVVITVASTFALAAAIDVTGDAAALADQLIALFEPWGTIGLLFGIYLSTAILTQLITNNGAAALMYPIALSTKTGVAVKENLNPYAVIFILMLSASASFSTPFGYQCNMMVHRPGQYTFMDWVRYSLGLQIILAALAPFVCDWFWPSPR